MTIRNTQTSTTTTEANDFIFNNFADFESGKLIVIPDPPKVKAVDRAKRSEIHVSLPGREDSIKAAKDSASKTAALKIQCFRDIMADVRSRYNSQDLPALYEYPGDVVIDVLNSMCMGSEEVSVIRQEFQDFKDSIAGKKR